MLKWLSIRTFEGNVLGNKRRGLGRAGIFGMSPCPANSGIITISILSAHIIGMEMGRRDRTTFPGLERGG